jgi:hypothetical protein
MKIGEVKPSSRRKNGKCGMVPKFVVKMGEAS